MRVSPGRRALATLAGLIAAVAVLLLIEWFGRALYAPMGAATDAAAIGDLLRGAPGAGLLVVLGWFAGSAIGGALAVRLSGAHGTAWIVAALVAIGAAAGPVIGAQPPSLAWFAAGAAIVGAPAAIGVARWSARRSAERL